MRWRDGRCACAATSKVRATGAVDISGPASTCARGSGCLRCGFGGAVFTLHDGRERGAALRDALSRAGGIDPVLS
jgi:hypothetical protein